MAKIANRVFESVAELKHLEMTDTQQEEMKIRVSWG
jgi:hypothetical protein